MIEVLDLNEPSGRDSYDRIIKSFNSKEPYNSLEFIYSFSEGFTDLICIKYSKDSVTVMLPGYLRKIEGTNHLDFISPYGYSGLVYSKDIPISLLESGWHSIKEYLDKTFISSFLRFSLDSEYSIFRGDAFPLMKNIKGVIIDYDSQWDNCEHKVRKNINRAKKENLKSEIIRGNLLSDDQLISFYDIYIDTMKRNNASEKYFFPLDNFHGFVKSRGDLCAFCFIYDNGKAVSTEMILQSDDSIFSFLGGTLKDAFQKRPNDFLKYALINWARDEGFKFFVLGGGYGVEDGIYKYKKSFFPNDVVDYYVGKLIHNETVYLELVEQSKHRFLSHGDKTEEDFNNLSYFPLYRAI